MFKRLVLVTLIGMFVSCGMLIAAPVITPEVERQIDSAIESAIARKIMPSAAVVVGTKDKVLFAKAYGKLTYEEDAPKATLDTLYDLASVSKAVGTASAAHLLIQDGKLMLDDPVRKYIPEFKTEDKKGILVRHLLLHISGLPSYTRAALAEELRAEGESKADAMIKQIASLPLRYKTAEGHGYACLNFITLGRICENITGKPNEEFLKERVFEPLGMKNTGYQLTDSQKSVAAPTGVRLKGTVHDPLAAYYSDENHSGGNAGLFSTANDLSNYCRMILSGGQEIFAPETIDLIATNGVPLRVNRMYGHGWVRYSSPPYGTKLNRGFHKAAFGHGGYTGTFVRIDRLSGIYVIMLTNRVYPNDNTSDGRIRREVVGILMRNDPVYEEVLSDR